MKEIIKTLSPFLRSNTKGNAFAWIIAALIIGGAIVTAVYIFTSSQTHPFWEVR